MKLNFSPSLPSGFSVIAQCSSASLKVPDITGKAPERHVQSSAIRHFIRIAHIHPLAPGSTRHGQSHQVRLSFIENLPYLVTSGLLLQVVPIDDVDRLQCGPMRMKLLLGDLGEITHTGIDLHHHKTTLHSRSVGDSTATGQPFSHTLLQTLYHSTLQQQLFLPCHIRYKMSGLFNF